jgi:uncharacterized coiled-coil DUF342 family protein
MKQLIGYIVAALVSGLFVMWIMSTSNSKLKTEVDKLHKQNDSLTLAIDSTSHKIQQYDSIINKFENIVNIEKQKLINLNKKANEFKEKYNKEHNRIVAMSNADAAREFTNAFE